MHWAQPPVNLWIALRDHPSFFASHKISSRRPQRPRRRSSRQVYADRNVVQAPVRIFSSEPLRIAMKNLLRVARLCH